MKRLSALIAAGLLVIPIFGCQERETQKPESQMEKPAAQQADQKSPTTGEPAEKQEKAVAQLQPTQGNNVTGTVTFTRQAEGIEVMAELQGLSPGKHGFHVHENGDCSAPDASSAGGHYNPDGTPHGAPGNPPDQRHVGDLGNIEAGPDGSASYRQVDRVIRMDGPQSIIDKALVVHAGADDFTSQPAGDSGPRVACGVIKKQQDAGE